MNIALVNPSHKARGPLIPETPALLSITFSIITHPTQKLNSAPSVISPAQTFHMIHVRYHRVAKPAENPPRRTSCNKLHRGASGLYIYIFLLAHQGAAATHLSAAAGLGIGALRGAPAAVRLVDVPLVLHHGHHERHDLSLSLVLVYRRNSKANPRRPILYWRAGCRGASVSRVVTGSSWRCCFENRRPSASDGDDRLIPQAPPRRLLCRRLTRVAPFSRPLLDAPPPLLLVTMTRYWPWWLSLASTPLGCVRASLSICAYRIQGNRRRPLRADGCAPTCGVDTG